MIEMYTLPSTQLGALEHMSEDQNEKIVENVLNANNAINQLLEDMEDEAFWTDENWESNNKRDDKGLPVE
jgi:hypothetical protein